MRVRYSIKHTISVATVFLLLLSLVPIQVAHASPDTVTLRPNASGDLTQLLPKTAPNYGEVDEAVADSDTSYVEHDQKGTGGTFKADLYNLPDSGIPAGSTINNVTFYYTVKKIQIGTAIATYAKATFKTHGITYVADAYTLTTSYAEKNSIYTTNPNTTVAWTIAEIDALQAGVSVQFSHINDNLVSYGRCTQFYVVIDYTLLGKAWYDVSTWTPSLVTKAWSSGTSWAANLIARTWSSGTSWSLNLLTRTWSSGTSWIENLQTRIWTWNPTVVIDSYNESNFEPIHGTLLIYALHPSSTVVSSAYGQSFTMLSTDHIITSCKFYLKKFGSPTGMGHAVLYAHQGTYGTNSTPTGEALATSNDFDVSTLTTSPQLITFTFNSTQQYQMLASTYYCVDFENPTSGTIDSSNMVVICMCRDTNNHSGNSFSYRNSTFFSGPTYYDTIFYVYGTPLFSFSLLARQYITVASWLFDFGTRIWVDAATWTYNLVTMAWQNIAWTFYLGTSIWKDIATWTTNLSAMFWNDVATWVLYPITRLWNDIAVWLFTLTPPQWVNVAVWTFYLTSPKWMLVALWNLQLGETLRNAKIFVAATFIMAILIGIPLLVLIMSRRRT